MLVYYLFLSSFPYLFLARHRQGKYCNNLSTRVIPFFVVSKSSVGETILETVLPHFLGTPLPRYRWRHNLRSPQQFLFQTCLNYISLGCSLCTDQFLIKHYGFKMQGKRDIASDTKCYDVINGNKGKILFFGK